MYSLINQKERVYIISITVISIQKKILYLYVNRIFNIDLLLMCGLTLLCNC